MECVINYHLVHVQIINELHFVSSDTGKLMARYCLAFESMKLFLGLQGNEDLNELVRNALSNEYV